MQGTPPDQFTCWSILLLCGAFLLKAPSRGRTNLPGGNPLQAEMWWDSRSKQQLCLRYSKGCCREVDLPVSDI